MHAINLCFCVSVRFMDGVPDDVLNIVRKRSTKSQNSRFPFKLKALLDWAGKDEKKSEICGCGWINNTIFFLDKIKLAELFEIKSNTINQNLKDLGFSQAMPRNGKLTYYTHPNIHINSKPEDLEAIKYNERPKISNLPYLNFFGVYVALLEDIILYGLTDKEITAFKHNVIVNWEKIIKPLHLFAISYEEFTESFEEQAGVCNDPYALQEALTSRNPGVIDIIDFAKFMARFGPFDNIIFKLGKFQQIIPDIRIDMTQLGTISSFFGCTYHNCFSFKLNCGEYHCYNLPHIGSSSNYLQNEENERFQSWQVALQNTSLLQSQIGFMF